MYASLMVRYVLQKFTGTKRMAWQGENENQTIPGLSIMENENTEPRLAICINNAGYVDDLKVRTVYQVLPDESAAKSNYIRAVDETGEDYLYPAAYFVFVEVPPEAVKTLMLTAS